MIQVAFFFIFLFFIRQMKKRNRRTNEKSSRVNSNGAYIDRISGYRANSRKKKDTSPPPPSLIYLSLMLLYEAIYSLLYPFSIISFVRARGNRQSSWKHDSLEKGGTTCDTLPQKRTPWPFVKSGQLVNPQKGDWGRSEMERERERERETT